MRFLVDECAGPALARWLREQGHDVYSVFDEARGLDDEPIITKANDEDWILITTDKDFGAKIYRDQRSHKGIILLRLSDERQRMKIATMQRLLEMYADRLPNSYIVVTEQKVRIRQ